MHTAPRYARYLAWLTTTFAALCLLAAAFNYAVDPYGIFGSPRIEGFNARKPAAAERVRTSKPYLATAARPSTVIVGNSRPELGLDPQSDCWVESDKPVFNAGIPGAGLYMQLQYAKHALMAGKGKQVLVAVDFVDFLEDTTAPAGPRDWPALARGYAGRLDIPGENVGLWQRMSLQAQDKLGALFSLNTLAESITTVVQQGALFGADRRPDGFNPGRDYEAVIRNEGQHVLFAQKNAELRARLARPGLGLLRAGEQASENFEALHDFLAWSRQRGVTVKLFINPYHADYHRIIADAGLGDTYREWTHRVTEIAAATQVPFWDFNADGALLNETPPGPNKRGERIRWFWEPAHYTADFGEAILWRVLGNASCRFE